MSAAGMMVGRGGVPGRGPPCSRERVSGAAERQPSAGMELHEPPNSD